MAFYKRKTDQVVKDDKKYHKQQQEFFRLLQPAVLQAVILL